MRCENTRSYQKHYVVRIVSWSVDPLTLSKIFLIEEGIQ